MLWPPNFGWLNNLLHHNNGFHFTHHHYPTIPWYRLPQATRALAPGQGDISHGFFDTYHSLVAGSVPRQGPV